MNLKINSKMQTGSTIIVVMIILLMITIVGVYAIRTAMTSLNIATNAQVGQFLSQTADTPINQIFIEDVIRQTNLASVMGKALKEHDTEPGKEYVFCYKPKDSKRFATVLSMAVLKIDEDGKIKLDEGSTDSFCDLSKDFGSARNAVVTQVALKIPTDSSELPPLALLARGTNVSGGQSIPEGITEQQLVRITTVSVMPAYIKDLNAAQKCMKNPYINDNTDIATRKFTTTAQCLVNLGVPADSQMQEFNLQTFLTMVREPT